MDSQAYHLAELRIALCEEDPRRVMPRIPADCRRVLDVGCGAGQTLIASKLAPCTFSAGVDLDLEALRSGRQFDQSIQFICASAERLPFRDGCFDFVISRVALPYMDIAVALSEISRVSRPGARLWIVLHPASMTLRDLSKSVRELNLKDAVYRLYVLANGLSFHFTGKVFRFFLNQQRCESFQTGRGFRHALRAAGFEQIEIHKGSFFVVTATKKTNITPPQGIDDIPDRPS